MIIVVSDVHLGYEESDSVAFENFVFNYVSENLTPDDHFVLLGDILDFWRGNNIDAALENKRTLTKILNLDTNVHYVIGNHDYYMVKIKKRFPEYRAFDLRRYLRITDGKKKFFFIHGYELDVLANYEPLTLEEYEKISESLCRAENILGKIMSELWGLKKKIKKSPENRKSLKRRKVIVPYTMSHMNHLEKFACSTARNIFLGLEKEEKLVFGHTHNPFINADTANPGSWVKNAPKHNYYIRIESGKMKLEQWDEFEI